MSLRPVTQKLWDNLMLDLMPDSTAQVVDFGIVSREHFGALQHAVKHGEMDASDLDPYCGDGPALTMLCADTVGQPYRVTFRTPWDNLLSEKED